jgi:hypothetical protein
MSYFDKVENYKKFIKILLGIIIALIITNLLIVKGLMSVAASKTIVLQVPGYLEKGTYVISGNKASPKVYKMWVRLWVNTIGNFSYKNVENKYKFIYEFLDPQTAFKNKANIKRFIEFVKQNFITQSFHLQGIKLQRLPHGYVKVIAYGTINRYIGNRKDELSGVRYAYEFVTYVNNGQIYISSIKSYFYKVALDKKSLNKLKSNKFMDYKHLIQ